MVSREVERRIPFWDPRGRIGGTLQPRNVGLIPRALSHIINGMNGPKFKQTFGDSEDTISLEMSYLEDYQNNIYDLLSPTTRIGQTKPSLIARSDAQGILHVANLTVSSILWRDV